MIGGSRDQPLVDFLAASGIHLLHVALGRADASPPYRASMEAFRRPLITRYPALLG